MSLYLLHAQLGLSAMTADSFNCLVRTIVPCSPASALVSFPRDQRHSLWACGPGTCMCCWASRKHLGIILGASL